MLVPLPLTKLWPLLCGVFWPIAPPEQPATARAAAAPSVSVSPAGQRRSPERPAARAVRLARYAG